MTLSTSQFTPCELKIIHLIMSNLFFTFVVNISLYLGSSCYFGGNWVSLSTSNSYYFLGNWVSLDQICALIFFFLLLSKGYCNYSSGSWAKGQNRTYTFGFHGPIYNFFGGRGPRLHILGQIENFLCTHILGIFFSFFWGGGGPPSLDRHAGQWPCTHGDQLSQITTDLFVFVKNLKIFFFVL